MTKEMETSEEISENIEILPEGIGEMPGLAISIRILCSLMVSSSVESTPALYFFGSGDPAGLWHGKYLFLHEQPASCSHSQPVMKDARGLSQ
jgi:hypothetical protein